MSATPTPTIKADSTLKFLRTSSPVNLFSLEGTHTNVKTWNKFGIEKNVRFILEGKKTKALYIFKITKNRMINVNTALGCNCQATVVPYNIRPVKSAAGMEERLSLLRSHWQLRATGGGVIFFGGVAADGTHDIVHRSSNTWNCCWWVI